MREIDPLISSYSHLKEKTREAEALTTLQKIASLVKPVMRQRGWTVGTLAEFYPAQQNLLGLNWNRGQKICIRLRYPGDERQFLPMDQVVDTMLHELSHIVHDAHDAKFHELWQQLRDEHEQLARKGYTGEGFLSDGRKLGGRRIPMDEARRKARAAAEKRRVLSAGSGQRLGGSILRRGVDMRQVIANAAQRRLAVTQGCASGSQNSREIVDQATQNGFRTQAEEDDANERAIMQAYIELLHEDEKERWGDSYLQASAENPSGSAAVEPKNKKMKRKGAGLESLSSRTATSAKIQPTDSEIDISINGPQDSYPTAIPADSRSPAMIWACPVCTLENPSEYLCCDACMSERPPTSTPVSSHTWSRPRSDSDVQQAKKPVGWVCHRCGNLMEDQWWTCSACGIMKLSS